MYRIAGSFGELVPDAVWAEVPGRDWKGGKVFPGDTPQDGTLTTAPLPTAEEALKVSRAMKAGLIARGYQRVTIAVQADNRVRADYYFIPRYWVGHEIFATQAEGQTWGEARKAEFESEGWLVTHIFVAGDELLGGKYGVKLTIDANGSNPNVVGTMPGTAAALSSVQKFGLGVGLVLSGLFLVGGLTAVVIARRRADDVPR